MEALEQADPITDILLGNDSTDGEGQTPDESEQLVEEPSAGEEIDDSEAEKPATLTVKDLAEKLEMTPEEVYSALSIKVGDSDLTLSQLKDGVKDLHRADELREAADEHKTQTENELLRQRREIQLAMQRYQPTEAEQREAEREFKAYLDREDQAITDVIPEWTDPEAKKAGRAQIDQLLADYAFSPAEAKTMVDHRYVKMAHDYAKLRTRLEQAKKEVKSSSKQASKGRRKATATGSDKAVQLHQAGKLDQASTIAAIIAEGINQ